MEDSQNKKQSKGWKVMGIISLVLGIISVLFSFIPCLGAYAMYSGILSAILSIIALLMANSAKASKMVSIIALAVSLLSVGIGYWRYTQLNDAATILKKGLEDIKDSLNKK